MKAKNILWVITAVVGIVTIAAGVAVLIDRYLGGKFTGRNYIECCGNQVPDYLEEE